MSDVTEASFAVDQLNCSRLFVDFRYAKASGTNRVGLVDPDVLDESCSAVRARWNFKISPSTAEEDRYPIAYVRTVYRVRGPFIDVFYSNIYLQDYLFLEQLLSVEYQPQNFVRTDTIRELDSTRFSTATCWTQRRIPYSDVESPVWPSASLMLKWPMKNSTSSQMARTSVAPSWRVCDSHCGIRGTTRSSCR